jgi:hypothetical protein
MLDKISDSDVETRHSVMEKIVPAVVSTVSSSEVLLNPTEKPPDHGVGQLSPVTAKEQSTPVIKNDKVRDVSQSSRLSLDEHYVTNLVSKATELKENTKLQVEASHEGKKDQLSSADPSQKDIFNNFQSPERQTGKLPAAKSEIKRNVPSTETFLELDSGAHSLGESGGEYSDSCRSDDQLLPRTIKDPVVVGQTGKHGGECSDKSEVQTNLRDVENTDEFKIVSRATSILDQKGSQQINNQEPTEGIKKTSVSGRSLVCKVIW